MVHLVNKAVRQAIDILSHSSRQRLLDTEVQMALSAHLAELSERHRVLEQKLAEALTHPSIDNLELSQLKREKLKLKDTINKLKGGQTEH